MVGIVCFLSTRYAQFAYKYINILETNNVEYEFVFWNREGAYNGEKDNWISYDEKLDSFQPFYKKVFSFCKYVKFLRAIIKEKKYERLIVLISQTAVPIFDLLFLKYKNNYIFDYRDITFENFYLYKVLIKKIVSNSYFTAISSNGFKECLGESSKFIVSHNSRNIEAVNVVKEHSSKIRVVYWGMVRQPNFNYRICDLFGNDNRFELYYHGAGYDNEIKAYCKHNNYSNIYITGAYDLDDIECFAKHADLLMNLYENDKKQKMAMTVKYYDSIKYGIPMIVMKDSYMARNVQLYKLGIAIDIEKNCLDRIVEYINSFNLLDYQVALEVVREKIKQDDNYFEMALLEYVR